MINEKSISLFFLNRRSKNCFLFLRFFLAQNTSILNKANLGTSAVNVNLLIKKMELNRSSSDDILIFFSLCSLSRFAYFISSLDLVRFDRRGHKFCAFCPWFILLSHLIQLPDYITFPFICGSVLCIDSPTLMSPA